jgi:hypothetical protein
MSGFKDNVKAEWNSRHMIERTYTSIYYIYLYIFRFACLKYLCQSLNPDRLVVAEAVVLSQLIESFFIYYIYYI